MFGTTPRKKFWSHFVPSHFVRTLAYETDFVQSYFVRTLAYGTWLRSLINAPCLDWGRFGRCRQKAITASCVKSAMMEGMRYEVCLLLQWLVGAPCHGYGQSSPCMHRVWIEVDSGDPVRKLTRYHMVFCAKSSLTCSRAKFSTRVDLDLEASRMFRPTPRKKIWSNFVLSYFVRCQDLGIRDLAPVSPCMHRVWIGVDSGVPVRKQTRHHASTLR